MGEEAREEEKEDLGGDLEVGGEGWRLRCDLGGGGIPGVGWGGEQKKVCN